MFAVSNKLARNLTMIMKRFLNRTSAGKELADKLITYKDMASVVLAIPRGGVPLGFEISRALQCPLGLVWVKKIGHPLSPELAIGAVSPDDYYVDYKSIASDTYIRYEIEKIRTRFDEMKNKFNDKTEEINLFNKIIILVDDGIATGHTISAAIRILRKKSPAKIIIAAPVAPTDTVAELGALADEVIIIYVPEFFTGISSFYSDFTQLKDEDVYHYLQMSTEKNSV